MPLNGLTEAIYMKKSKSLVYKIFCVLVSGFFMLANVFLLNPTSPAYAEPETTVSAPETTQETTKQVKTEAKQETTTSSSSSGTVTTSCSSQISKLGWVVCGATEIAANATDTLHGILEQMIVLSPVRSGDDSPIHVIWQYCRDITNIVFIIFLTIVVLSQITGYGITNYGIKKALPKLIVAAILVNLSFVVCALAVDVSNIIGMSLRGVFENVKTSTMGAETLVSISMSDLLLSASNTAIITVAGLSLAASEGVLFMIIPTVLCGLVAIFSALVTMAFRHAIVILLVMVSPLAIVANILPNTEQYYSKWKKTLTKMLLFYPMFSLMYGAADIAGWAIIMGSDGSTWLAILGILVQLVPLFYSWKMLKMSGTLLGAINQRTRAFFAKPLATNRAWAESRRSITKAKSTQYSKLPSAHLQRFMDNRKALRENTLTTLRKMRTNETGLYVDKKITGGYRGNKAISGNKGNLKANQYTRMAKDAANLNLQKSYSGLDTEHVLNNYEGYYVNNRSTRYAEDAKRAATAANNFLEVQRAQMTAENDSEADFNFMVSEYLKAGAQYDPNDPRSARQFKHRYYASAGGLGDKGQTRVLGKILAKAAQTESAQRRDINIIANKFPPDKRAFRDMIAGYLTNDDGLAVDKDGSAIEKHVGELLANDPSKLVLWDKIDEDGRPYFDWYDGNRYVTRIYKDDASAVKELLSNFDAPINDPFNNLLNILAGVKEGDIEGDDERLKLIGLDRYRTTIGRAVDAAHFKEKNACYGPMVAEMIKKGYVKNYAQENLAYLDSFNKATKPGAFNQQDHDAVSHQAYIMNPDNWEKAFPTELIRGYRNVNGEPIYGMRYHLDADGNQIKDANGNPIYDKIPAEEATREELMNRVKVKFLEPAAKKMMLYMSRQTQSTIDNQKGGTVGDWSRLKDVLSSKEYEAYEQDGDTAGIARDIKNNLYYIDKNTGERIYYRRRGNNNHDENSNNEESHDQGTYGNINHQVRADEIYQQSNGDPEEYMRRIYEYCGSHGLQGAWNELSDYYDDEVANSHMTDSQRCDALHERFSEILSYHDMN